MNKATEWSYEEHNRVAEMLRKIAEDAPPITASWLRELALAIGND